MKVLEDIKDLIEEELKVMKKKGSLSPAELDSIHKAVETIKYIDEICEEDEEKEEFEEKYSGRRSRGMRGNREYSGSYQMMYPMPIMNNGSGYSGGADPYYDNFNYSAGQYQNGPSQYSRNSYSGGNYSSGSYSSEGIRAGRNYGMNGYSREGAASHMVEKLEGMLESACTPREREAIRNCIDKLAW